MASTHTPSSSNLSSNGNFGNAIYILFILFFLWGFMTVMNDVLIPHLKKVFDLNYLQSMAVQFAFFGAYFIGSLIYFVISVVAGDPIQRIGYKNGIIAGLVVSALGCALFYPAASSSIYGLFLGALFVLGLGFTLLQIAANPYVAILGTPETASSRLNLAQGFNSFGTTIGPVIGGFLVFQYFADASGEPTAEAVTPLYLAMAAFFALVALGFVFIKLPKVTSPDNSQSGMGALQFPQLNFGILAIFFYVGGEVAIGSILINYLGLDHIAGLDENQAKNFLSMYWGGLMIGRFLGAISLSSMKDETMKWMYMFGTAILTFVVIYFVNSAFFDESNFLTVQQMAPWLIFIGLNLGAFYIGRYLPARTLSVFAGFILLLLGMVVFASGQVAVWSIIGIGLFCSIMWSNIFTLSINGLGEHTSQGSSLLVMGILGGALIPVVQGGVADFFATEANPDAGVQLSFIVPMLCFAYVLFYGIRGHKPKNNEN